MTFPVAAARTTTADASAVHSRSIGLGAPSAGDLLVVFANSASASGAHIIDPASGAEWFSVVAGVGSSLRLSVFAKVATGGGADVLTLQTLTPVRMAAVCYRVTGHGSTIAGGTTATATSTNGDPPSASFSGAAQDALFLTALATVSSVASAAPAGYGSLTTASAGTAFMSTAELAANGTSNDPGTFTNTSQQWVATTVAIPELAITTAARQTQEAVEAVSNISPTVRITQISAEMLSHVTAIARVTQVSVEMVSENVPDGLGGGPSMLFIAT